VRITLDATPLLGRRTGIGRYVAQLLTALPGAVAAELGDATVDVCTWSWRARTVPDLPPGVAQVGPRAPARVLRSAWARADLPPIELLVGRTDLFHGTNFVSPPTRHAAEVVTVHDLTYLRWAETVDAASLAYRDLVPRALRRGALVLTPSEAVAAQVRDEYRLGADRVAVTPLGVDDPWFSALPLPAARRDQLGLPDDYLLFVGATGPRKNLDRLLLAHREARSADPGTPPLVLAGPAGAATLEPREGVVTTGWLDDGDLHALVAGARAVLLPSLDEGFGLPVLEALAAGRPLLASGIDTLREVGGPWATYVDPTDVDAIAAGLSTVSRAQDTAEQREARRAYARTFTWARCAEATAEAYRTATQR